jgi:uncharacterized membrane protein
MLRDSLIRMGVATFLYAAHMSTSNTRSSRVDTDSSASEAFVLGIIILILNGQCGLCGLCLASL